MTLRIAPGIATAFTATRPNTRAPDVSTRNTAAQQVAAGRVTLSPEARAMRSSGANAAANAVPDTAAWRFPPASAPANVQAAWAETTQGMSDLERVSAEGAFMAEEISANLKYNATGQAVGVLQRGEPGYTDLWNQPDLSYTEQVDRMLEKLEQNRSAYNDRDYTFFNSMLSRFRSGLEQA